MADLHFFRSVISQRSMTTFLSVDSGPSRVYDHPTLSWAAIHNYYNLFYRRFYLRPETIWRQLKRDAFSLNLFYDVAYFLKTKW